MAKAMLVEQPLKFDCVYVVLDQSFCIVLPGGRSQARYKEN